MKVISLHRLIGAIVGIVPRATHQRPAYEVYHRKQLDLTILFGQLPQEIAVSDYQKVAEVRADDLEEVFALTNHCSELPWWQHSQVTPAHAQPKYRSTSVGDVVAEAGQVWMVASSGFVTVTWAKEDAAAIALPPVGSDAWWHLLRRPEFKKSGNYSRRS